MKSDHDITCYSVNRLDRLTSGLMILALTSKASRHLAEEFMSGSVRKEYVARVRGRFPDQIVEVDLPLLTVDRQMGLVIVTPEGKEARTVFKKLWYDVDRDESVVHCRPLTGRTHQIRVHLQYLGHAIANDPLYGPTSVWGEDGGKGGVDLNPHHPDANKRGLAAHVLEKKERLLNGTGKYSASTTPLVVPGTQVDEEDRDYVNLDVTSPIALSSQARDIIVRLRRMKDEQENWAQYVLPQVNDAKS